MRPLAGLHNARSPFSLPISGRLIATKVPTALLVPSWAFSLPISGRLIATPSIRFILWATYAFQSAHLWETDCDSQR